MFLRGRFSKFFYFNRTSKISAVEGVIETPWINDLIKQMYPKATTLADIVITKTREARILGKGDFTSTTTTQSLYSCEWFIITVGWVNDSKFCPSFYSQKLLSFDSLSRHWILKLDPNDNFRN